ncbi:NUDIX domain-containing protein [Actinomycetospora soli]|uniref:NUDIX domain-containing protein n=1 Tax=Actinomycetospora soli TaxID=2893887 RepID=UPI001E3C2A19|nr:NUDIX domain-containing protein [Actinomycetospora soli]MCD2188257.1 NUDIX domain-containing protein [Actinomycetospora soli]
MRLDYFDDPKAPTANSIVPSVTAATRDEYGRVLLIHKIDNGFWALPGGAMELGESVRDAAVREVEEETSVRVEVTGLVGIYTDPGHVMVYDDGEVRQEFSICFHARPLGGKARGDMTESKAARWVEPSELSKLSIHPSMRRRIDRALEATSEPEII